MHTESAEESSTAWPPVRGPSHSTRRIVLHEPFKEDARMTVVMSRLCHGLAAETLHLLNFKRSADDRYVTCQLLRIASSGVHSDTPVVSHEASVYMPATRLGARSQHRSNRRRYHQPELRVSSAINCSRSIHPQTKAHRHPRHPLSASPLHRHQSTPPRRPSHRPRIPLCAVDQAGLHRTSFMQGWARADVLETKAAPPRTPSSLRLDETILPPYLGPARTRDTAASPIRSSAPGDGRWFRPVQSRGPILLQPPPAQPAPPQRLAYQ